MPSLMNPPMAASLAAVSTVRLMSLVTVLSWTGVNFLEKPIVRVTQGRDHSLTHGYLQRMNSEHIVPESMRMGRASFLK